MDQKSSISGRIKEAAVKTAQCSTSHGLPNIVNSEHTFYRVFWLASLIACSIFCAFLIYRTVSDYAAFEVVTSIRTILETPMKFPTVSICNTNFVVNNKSLEHANRLLAADKSMYTESAQYPSLVKSYFPMSIAASNLSDAEKQSYGSSLNEFVLVCQFGMLDCDLAHDFVWYFDAYHGNCFRFNSGRSKHGTPVSVRLVSNGGPINGLVLKLFIAHSSEYNSLTSNYGAHVFVHNNSDPPFFSEGFEVPVDAQTNIEVARVSSEKLPSPYNDCVQDVATVGSVFTDMFARHGMAYSQHDCFTYCAARYIAERCHCAYVAFPLMNFSLPTCREYIEYKCSVSAFTQFYMKYVTVKCSRECPPECSSLVYSVSSTMSSFPEPSYLYHLLSRNEALARREFNMSSGDFRRAILDNDWSAVPSKETVAAKLKGKTLSLNVYYGNTIYTSIEESPKTTALDLVAGIGGMLGLFVGMSFMTFMEFIELLLKILVIVVENWSLKSKQLAARSHSGNRVENENGLL